MEDLNMDEKDSPSKVVVGNNVNAYSNIVTTDSNKEQLTGELSKNFGTGDNAKVNLILYIISTTLIIFSSIAAALIVINIYGFNTDAIIQHIKDLWAIFTPIITLGLGYLFGTSKTEDVKQSEIKSGD